MRFLNKEQLEGKSGACSHFNSVHLSCSQKNIFRQFKLLNCESEVVNFNTIVNLVAYTNISLPQTNQLAITLLSPFAVKTVKYHADWSEQTTHVNCCQVIIGKMEKN